MKARKPNNKEEKVEIKDTERKYSKKGFDLKPSVPELMSQIKEDVIEDFDYLCEKNPDSSVMEVLNHMMGISYAKTFKPYTPLMERCLNINVTNFVKSKITEILEEKVKKSVSKEKISEEEILEQMESENYITENFGEDIPVKLKKLAESSLQKFIEAKRKNLSKDDKTNADKEKEVNKKEDKINEDKEKEVNKKEDKMNEDKKKEDNIKKVVKPQLDKISEPIVRTSKPKQQRKIMQKVEIKEFEKLKQKYPDMSLVDLKFLLKVKRCTDNFSFLAESREEYFAKVGAKKLETYKGINEYEKFEKIQTRLRKAIERLGTNESEAIKRLIKESKGRLSQVEMNILKERNEVLTRNNQKTFSDEQEM